MDSSGSTPWWVGVALALVAGPLVPPVGPGPTGAQPRAAAVLHAWDRQRARAWARDDVTALRALYTPHATAGRADVTLLRHYRARGLSVRGLRMQVLSLAVLAASPTRVRVRVVDRLAAGRACDGARCVPLPRDRADRRTILLRRTAGRWRVAAVR